MSAPRKEIIDVETPTVKSEEETPAQMEARVQAQLGMTRATDDLGYRELRFNPCDQHFKTAGGSCAPRFMTVLHFQLKCRDTEGTVSSVPTDFTALTAAKVLWSLGGRTGATSTDLDGYGQVVLVTEKSARGRQLILRIGKQFMGFTGSEITKVVLPRNYCAG